MTRPTRRARSDVSRPAAPAGNRRLGLVGLCVSAALVWLAFADFGVAVPTISRDLGGSLSVLQWASNAFSLTFTMTSMLGGSIGVALLVAVEQAAEVSRAAKKASAAGLSDQQITTLKRAVVDSKVVDQVLARVGAASKAALQEAFRMVEAAGIATALRVAGVLALLSCVVVLWLWHAPDRQ